MTLPDLDPSRSAKQLFGDIVKYVEEADAMVKAREPLLLAGLDTAVDALCARIVALPAEEGKKHLAELNQLMGRITALQENMVKLQAEIATTLNSVGKQKKASKAYNNAPSGKVEV
ncbi:MAG: hypothetical protein ACOYNL_06025 [Rickettsiales bacterium]